MNWQLVRNIFITENEDGTEGDLQTNPRRLRCRMGYDREKEVFNQLYGGSSTSGDVFITLKTRES